MFHSAVAECNAEFALTSGAISASQLPKGFSYYASGHVHSRCFVERSGRTIGFPGPTFGSDYRDLESSAQGERKGFFMIEFSGDRITGNKFIEASSPEIMLKEYDASGRSSQKAGEDLEGIASSEGVKGKIFLLKIVGELSSGNPGDIDFPKIKDTLVKNGASVVYINRNSLAAREQAEIKAAGETREEIEANLFTHAHGSFRTDNEKLAKEGIALSLELLKLLKEEQKGGTKSDHEKKILESSMRLLDLQG
jgi:DNA repair exonuclease SbcCD nuclease subunit